MKTKPTLVVAAATLLAGGIVHAGDGVVARMDAVTIGANGGVLELGPTATMAFSDSSAKTWSGTLLIKGFRDGAVRFGTSAAALTAEQVTMLRAEKPNGRTVHLYITSDGYLALRGMVISIR